MSEADTAAAAVVGAVNKRHRQTLIEIGQELTALSELMYASADENGELPSDVSAQLEAWFAEINTDLETKIDNTAAFARVLKLRAAIRKEEVERMQALYCIDNNLFERVKRRLYEFMSADGNPSKIKTRRFNLSVCGSGGVQPMEIDDIDPAKVPEKYRKTSIDHSAVREDLEAGVVFPWARLRDRGTHLRGL